MLEYLKLLIPRRVTICFACFVVLCDGNSMPEKIGSTTVEFCSRVKLNQLNKLVPEIIERQVSYDRRYSTLSLISLSRIGSRWTWPILSAFETGD